MITYTDHNNKNVPTTKVHKGKFSLGIVLTFLAIDLATEFLVVNGINLFGF